HPQAKPHSPRRRGPPHPLVHARGGQLPDGRGGRALRVVHRQVGLEGRVGSAPLVEDAAGPAGVEKPAPMVRRVQEEARAARPLDAIQGVIDAFPLHVPRIGENKPLHGHCRIPRAATGISRSMAPFLTPYMTSNKLTTGQLWLGMMRSRSPTARSDSGGTRNTPCSSLRDTILTSGWPMTMPWPLSSRMLRSWVRVLLPASMTARSGAGRDTTCARTKAAHVSTLAAHACTSLASLNT